VASSAVQISCREAGRAIGGKKRVEIRRQDEHGGFGRERDKVCIEWKRRTCEESRLKPRMYLRGFLSQKNRTASCHIV